MKERRGIMSACEYSIQTLQDIKKTLLVIDGDKQGISWALGGIIVTLASHILKFSLEVIEESMKHGDSDAKKDLTEIRNRFNNLVDTMMEVDAILENAENAQI